MNSQSSRLDEQTQAAAAYALVAVDAPLPKPLTYAVPESLIPLVTPGLRVLVPLGKKRAIGYILEISAATHIPAPRDIIGLLDEKPLFDPIDLDFYRWTAEYYQHPLGKTLAEITPGSKVKKNPRLAAGKITTNGGPETLIGPPADRRVVTAVNLPILNVRQKRAANVIVRSLQDKTFSPFLLHGVTASGKTEVYLRAICSVLNEGSGALYLVPEIALTPQLIGRLKERFPGEPFAILHSGLTPAKRLKQWRLIQEGKIRLVMGARSAVFAPVKNLRLIIVDEEHDTSYKQDERLKYNARDLAVIKAKIWKATVILGSATPDIQSFYNAQVKKYSYLSLPERIQSRPLPAVEIVDLKRFKGDTLLSDPLKEALEDNLAAGRQALLFLNRRGFHTLVICVYCGRVVGCRNCSVALTYHRAKEGRERSILKCHHCDFTQQVPEFCPSCKQAAIKKLGYGTERVEAELRQLFPLARIRRMDSDTMTRQDDYLQVLSDFERKKIDILVGTQMITKGHDFPQVTLIGVILADATLNLPDFRAAERTFQLLTQVSGRGGRGDTPGRVIIQTMNPNHYAIRAAQDHNYKAFYQQEITERRILGYPPFGRLINIHISSLNPEEGLKRVRELGIRAREIWRNREGVEVIGPAESPLEKVRGLFRWQLLLKGQDLTALHELARAVLAAADSLKLKTKIDVDPINFM